MGTMLIKPIKMMMDSRIDPIRRVGHYFAYLWQYRGIFKQLVEKEFKGKFKNTILGYFWHVLNPLTQIAVYLVIFTIIFGKDVPNYWVYVSTGMFIFTFFISSTAYGGNCIIANSSLVTKMAMAREMIVISKVTTHLITLSISYVLLAFLMIIMGVGITVNILWVPLIVFLMIFFNIGLCLFISSVSVYVRDIANVITTLFSLLMFALPIVYLAELRSTPAMELFWFYNPLYHYINAIHDTFYYGVSPDLVDLIICLVSAFVSLIVGLFVFKKLERGFAERL